MSELWKMNRGQKTHQERLRAFQYLENKVKKSGGKKMRENKRGKSTIKTNGKPHQISRCHHFRLDAAVQGRAKRAEVGDGIDVLDTVRPVRCLPIYPGPAQPPPSRSARPHGQHVLRDRRTVHRATVQVKPAPGVASGENEQIFRVLLAGVSVRETSKQEGRGWGEFGWLLNARRCEVLCRVTFPVGCCTLVFSRG